MSRRRQTQNTKHGTSDNFQEELDGVDVAGEIDDDPELASMIRKQNEELKAQGIPNAMTDFGDDEPVANMDLTADARRLAEAIDLAPPEDFEILEKPEIGVSTTLNEFQNNIAMAQLHGIESIEADRRVINHFTKPNYPKSKFFHYHGVRVIEAGFTDHVNQVLGMSIEEKVFKHGAHVSQK